MLCLYTCIVYAYNVLIYMQLQLLNGLALMMTLEDNRADYLLNSILFYHLHGSQICFVITCDYVVVIHVIKLQFQIKEVMPK